MRKIKKIYISGALTSTGHKERIIYENLANISRKYCRNVHLPHSAGADPYVNPEKDVKKVWESNHYEITSSNFVIAYVGKPSLGVGTELEIARVSVSDLIIWWFEGDQVSRMAKGNPAVTKMIEAKDEDDLYDQITKILEEYNKPLKK